MTKQGMSRILHVIDDKRTDDDIRKIVDNSREGDAISFKPNVEKENIIRAVNRLGEYQAVYFTNSIPDEMQRAVARDLKPNMGALIGKDMTERQIDTILTNLTKGVGVFVPVNASNTSSIDTLEIVASKLQPYQVLVLDKDLNPGQASLAIKRLTENRVVDLRAFANGDSLKLKEMSKLIPPKLLIHISKKIEPPVAIKMANYLPDGSTIIFSSGIRLEEISERLSGVKETIRIAFEDLLPGKETPNAELIIFLQNNPTVRSRLNPQHLNSETKHAIIDEAATKIQAVFRGFKARNPTKATNKLTPLPQP